MERTILLVEDSDDVREMSAQFLQSEGFNVVVASNGQEAVDLAERLQPDLILMDLNLPVMNGRAAAKRIKTDPATDRIPIILLTAYGREGSNAVIEAGCDGFLTKPADPKEIVTEIERVLKRRGRVGR